MNEKSMSMFVSKDHMMKSNKIRNTRQYVSAVLKSNFGQSQLKKASAFALAFEKALAND